MKSAQITFALVLSVVLGAFVACSANGDAVVAPQVSLPDSGAHDAASVSHPDADNGGSDSDEKDSAPPPDKKKVIPCADTSTKQACVTCCSTAHPGGASVYLQKLLSCVCVADKCQTQCASTGCAMQVPDATCQECIDTNGGTCVPEVNNVCDPVPDCVAFVTCGSDANCLGKP